MFNDSVCFVAGPGRDPAATSDFHVHSTAHGVHWLRQKLAGNSPNFSYDMQIEELGGKTTSGFSSRILVECLKTDNYSTVFKTGLVSCGYIFCLFDHVFLQACS